MGFEKFFGNTKGGGEKKPSEDEDIKKREKEAEELLGKEGLKKHDREMQRIEGEQWWGDEDLELSEKRLDQIVDIFCEKMGDYEDKHYYYASAGRVRDDLVEYFDGLLRRLGKNFEINPNDFDHTSEFFPGSDPEDPGSSSTAGEITFKGTEIVHYDVNGEGMGMRIDVKKENLKKVLKEMLK